MAQANIKTIEEITEALIHNGYEQSVPRIMEILLNNAMVAERQNHLNALPYERSEKRVDVANGFKPKKVKTRYGELSLVVPQTRHSDFYPECLEKGLRSERAFITTIAEMYLQGVSTRKVTHILEEMCGISVSSSQVSRCVRQLDEELHSFRNRPLDSFAYLMIDARYEFVRYGGFTKKLAVIWGIGVTFDGRREVLGVTVSLSEAEVYWREFLKSLIERGLSGVKFVVSDDHSGLKAALFSVFPNVIWQRCQTHLARNAQSYVARKTHKEDVASELRDILQAPDLEMAQLLLSRFVETWKINEPKLSEWAEQNVPESFNVFALAKGLRKKLRTSNLIERLNQELKRRSTVIRIFPNEESCLRLMSALTLEIHEDWSTGRRFFPANSVIENQTIGNSIYRKNVA